MAKYDLIIPSKRESVIIIELGNTKLTITDVPYKKKRDITLKTAIKTYKTTMTLTLITMKLVIKINQFFSSNSE
jgi:hypothetical protein